jgi:hypothetical protein
LRCVSRLATVKPLTNEAWERPLYDASGRPWGGGLELIRTSGSTGPYTFVIVRGKWGWFIVNPTTPSLEQSAVVWHSSLSEENKSDLERVQKSAVKIIMGEKYQSYQKSLALLDMETLEDRRENLCLKFAQRCLKNDKAKKMFPINQKSGMKTRKMEKYHVQHANTDRLQNFALIYMQNLLNENEKTC